MKKTPSPTEPPPDTRPLWTPPGADFSKLSPSLQYALREIVDPLYKELVLEAPNAFERSIGITYCSLAWLELSRQVELGELEFLRPGQGPPEGCQERIAQYLRLVAVKDRTARFLLELAKTMEKLGDTDPLRRVPR
jgi:hypothetical protein